MIHLTRSPLRVSLMGGGTDFPSYFNNYNGAVISFTINKYVYVLTKEKFDKKIKLSYSKNEHPKEVKKIKHNLIRHIFNYMKIKNNIEFTSLADIHSHGTGLGSSSAFTLASVASLNSYLNNRSFTKKKMAEIACHIEIEKNKSPIGYQDQYASAFGGFNFINFKKSGVTVKKMNFSSDELKFLNNSLILYNTNIFRKTNSILSYHLNNISNNKNTLYLKELFEETLLLNENLIKKNLDFIPKSLNKSWELKKKFNDKTINKKVENLINKGKRNGAKGAKLLGAGKGGFILFFVNPKEKKKFISTMGPKNILNFDFDNFGTRTNQIV